jgi:hypothetical protein
MVPANNRDSMPRLRLKKSMIVFAILSVILACNIPSPTEIPVTEAPAAEVVVSAVDTATSEPPTEPPIQHEIVPVSLPELDSGHAGDQDSSVTADEKRSAGGDRFTFEQFERPFNATTMDVYYPNLDIVDTLVHQDDTWIYGTIQLKDRSAAASSPYLFAIQLDVDLNGKGDWLIVTSNPSGTDWTTDGVQIFMDENRDVGDQTPMFTDEDAADGDGFEKLVFDQGKGDDPDSAWVRISPRDSNVVEIAVKRSVLGNPTQYMINMWTGHATLNPGLFDYSDHYTHERAGAADPAFEFFYPIKEVYELDNTCRMAVGFNPTGKEPGLCVSAQRVPPGEPSGCVPTPAQLAACSQYPCNIWNNNTCQCECVPPPG